MKQTFTEKAVSTARQAWRENYNPDTFDCGESCTPVNKASRGIVRAVLSEHGQAWIWTCNPYEKTEVVRQYRSGMVYNFDGSFVTGRYDVQLELMMKDRLAADYTGTRDDTKRINAIFDRAEALGAILLHWS